ncbi:hypothetical protein OJ253_3597 [Cryptosporidium canis]|uniref:Uncharacterized protein n=1 Tax=Cryptosporidium canis TaxID=195482 RepID=A0A9D5DDZ4_9CRYT|nr:hypothetical protein OJ253_3597 [Cryptosporidium canis]
MLLDPEQVLGLGAPAEEEVCREREEGPEFGVVAVVGPRVPEEESLKSGMLHEEVGEPGELLKRDGF